MVLTNNMDCERSDLDVHERTSPSASKMIISQHRRDSRIKTACSECKRRKVRCDGTHPCYFCRHYKQPERCIYALSRPALILSRKNFEAVRNRLDTATEILERLFPSIPIETLAPLSREELLQRLGSSAHGHSLRKEVNTGGLESAESDGLDEGQTSQGGESHRRTQSTSSDHFHEDASPQEGDDVNALSATSNHASSYVGPSSTMQMFRTILRIAPESLEKRQISQSPSDTLQNASLRSPETSNSASSPIKMSTRVASLIEAYFHWVHPATPILDEKDFRETAAAGARNDSPWLCLLNMVLALGSIGCTKTDSREHVLYYNTAKSHLEIETLGDKCLETLQALILMAGWYFHYRNRPNLASALLGAAFRMAHALGLHKEALNGTHPVETQELRRKIWWNLVVLDAAEAVTLGRTIDTNVFFSEVKYPQQVLQTTDEALGGPSAASMLIITIEFSRILTEVQGQLMGPNTLPFAQLLSLDAHLVDWYEALPLSFHKLPTSTESSESNRFQQPFSTIKWRYLNLRIMLYRPSLMEAVLDKIPFTALTSDQRLCIRKCLTLSGEMLDSVNLQSSEHPNQYIAWPATWYLLQVCMVPLLCLYVFRADGCQHESHPNASRGNQHQPDFRHFDKAINQVRQIRDDCHRQIQTTLRLMKEMEPWAIASTRMYDLIGLLYAARHQSLRVWNNTEESPIIILGSPETQEPQQPYSSNARLIRNDHASLLGPKYVIPTGVDSTLTIDTNAAGSEVQSSTSTHSLVSNQFEQFSKDWSMYNSFTWPNATLETLFDLPEDFQWMDQTTYSAG